MNIIKKFFQQFGFQVNPSQAIQLETKSRLRSVYRRELSDWHQARALRHDVKNPRTYLLQEVYSDTMLDAHLSSVVNNRILKIQNQAFIVRGVDHAFRQEATRSLQAPWFQKLLKYAIESIFYGYSLIWLRDFSNSGELRDLELVDRRYVIPERACILRDFQSGSKGLSYGKYPFHLLYVQLDDSIGLLEKATPLTLLKRHSWANWDEFEQIFGMPLRIARVPNVGSHEIAEIESWLEHMGTASYAILPSSAEIEIKDSSSSDAHEVFQEKIKQANLELSKLIIGQTMSVEAGSSRSQSEVHERTEHRIMQADLRKLLNWLNHTLLPALRYHRYPIEEGDYIDIREEPRPQDRIKIDKVLLQAGVRLSSRYLENTYGVELADSLGSSSGKTMTYIPPSYTTQT
ncbi:MAG: DUF935 family protein [Cytophagales bacterium]|nr:DUF935 family protein [Cytophagales bacterium]